MPVVSIVIPTYNRAELLKRSVQSILDQTYQDFEVIVVDDGSTDNTEEVVKCFADNRIQYIKHDRNRGASAARNTGIRAASARYIAFQDSDDEWLPQKLEKQVGMLGTSSTEVGVVYSGFWKVRGRTKLYIPIPSVPLKEGDIHEVLLRRNFVGIPVTIIRRECFEKAGVFDEKLSMYEDWELWIRISKHYEFRYIAEPLVITHCSAGGVNTQESLVLAKSIEYIVQKHLGEYSRRLLATHYFEIGALLCLNKKLAEGISYLVKAVVLYPLIPILLPAERLGR